MVYYWSYWLYIELHVYQGNELTVELVLSIYGSVGGLITQNWSEFARGWTCVIRIHLHHQKYPFFIGRSHIQRYRCVGLGIWATWSAISPDTLVWISWSKIWSKNSLLAHFSEITSFNNRNNECMSPGNFSTLILLETKCGDYQYKLLKCSYQHYLWEDSTVKWRFKEDCAVIDSCSCNPSENLSFGPLVSPWRCLTESPTFWLPGWDWVVSKVVG